MSRNMHMQMPMNMRKLRLETMDLYRPVTSLLFAAVSVQSSVAATQMHFPCIAGPTRCCCC
jgi:hypothetical protein